MEYYHLLQKGIEVFFDQAAVIDQKFNKAEHSGSCYDLHKVAEMIPEVHSIQTTLGKDI
jgi:hypothetical protein